MNASEFVSWWKRAKDELVDVFNQPSGETEVGHKIASMQLNPKQTVVMHAVIDGILTDAFYTMLLGLDGAANIGGVQQQFQIRDESGNLISQGGLLETEAWEQFHGNAAPEE